MTADRRECEPTIALKSCVSLPASAFTAYIHMTAVSLTSPYPIAVSLLCIGVT